MSKIEFSNNKLSKPANMAGSANLFSHPSGMGVYRGYVFRMKNNGNNSEGVTVFRRNDTNMEGMTIIQKK